MAQLPNTNVTASYAYSLRVGGLVVGGLQGFSITIDSGMERFRELMNDDISFSDVVFHRTDFVITLDRLEIYDKPLASALSLTNPTDINISEYPDLFIKAVPFQIIESLRKPLDVARRIHYNDCYIKTYTKQVQEGTLTVRENVSMICKSVTKH